VRVSSFVWIGPAVWPAIRNKQTNKQTSKQTYRLLLYRLVRAPAVPPPEGEILVSEPPENVCSYTTDVHMSTVYSVIQKPFCNEVELTTS